MNASPAREGRVADPTEAFFEALDRERPAGLSKSVNGVLRIDLESDGRTDHWFISMNNGQVGGVSREGPPSPDAIVHTTKAVFDRLAVGETNYFVAVMRNELSVEVDPPALTNFARLLPGPPGATDPGGGNAERETP
jgi:hypothetical protein